MLSRIVISGVEWYIHDAVSNKGSAAGGTGRGGYNSIRDISSYVIVTPSNTTTESINLH